MQLVETVRIKRVRRDGKTFCPVPPFDSNTGIAGLLKTKRGQGLVQAINTQYDFLLTGGEGSICPYSDEIESLGKASDEEIENKVCKVFCEHYKNIEERGAFPIDMKKTGENSYRMK